MDYKEIKERNKKLVNTHGIKYDKVLLKEEKDERLCLAIFSNINNLKLKEIQSELKELNNTCVYYENNNSPFNGTLHFTLLQLLGFDHFKDLEDPSILVKLIPFLKEILPLKIRYKYIILTPSCIILCGLPDKDINECRKKIRKELKDFIKEPYLNNICHSTLCRFTGDIDTEKLNKIIEKYENYDFGETEITSFNIGYGTWKLNDYEIKILYKI